MNEVTWYLCKTKLYRNSTLINFKYNNNHYYTNQYQNNIKITNNIEMFDCCLQQTYEEYIKDNIHYPALKQHALKLTSNLYQELTK